MTAKKTKASEADNRRGNEPETVVDDTENKESEAESGEAFGTDENAAGEAADKEADTDTEKASKNAEAGSLGKVKKEKKDKKDEKIAELNDRVMRTMAEFDNFRKRTDKEKADMFENGAKSVIEKLLPVVDSFERGLSILSEEERNTPVAEGMDKIHKQLMKTLEDIGVTPIEAVGNEFDPNFHNAVMHGEDENFGENIVSEEFQKGYLYREKVVRHSMVKVVN